METRRPHAFLRERLISLLGRGGPASPSDLARQLGISQPTFWRLASSLRGQVLAFGQSRARRYALAREIPGVRQPIPVYEIRPAGRKPRHFGDLVAIGERGFHMEAEGSGSDFEDLPWFLQNLRPSGTLGRWVPVRHPELGLPEDIRLWTADHVMRFATRYGWDMPGAFLVGDEAFSRFLDQVDHPANLVDTAGRATRYPAIAEDLLSFGTAGSSAAGEQPKFLATRDDGDRRTPVLVKFSPPTGEAGGRRVADLLVAEQAALAILGKFGFPVPAAAILAGGDRVFLEVERFDRDGIAHRSGQVALEFLDAEFVGTGSVGWTASVEALAAKGVVPRGEVTRVRWLETFGRWIGNTDMHFGNLAFRMEGVCVTTLVPVHDMLPMYYHPRQGELPRGDPVLPPPGSAVADVAGSVLEAAAEFWEGLADDPRLSGAFREIAIRNRARMEGLRSRVQHLPIAASPGDNVGDPGALPGRGSG